MAKKNKQIETAQEKAFHEELITQMITLATSGFGLVAAFAWNETIKQFIDEFVKPRVPGSGITSNLLYALLVTALAVLVTYQLSRIAARFQKKN